jgi:anti-sigma B factor antagonist
MVVRPAPVRREVVVSLPVEIDMCNAGRVAEELTRAVSHHSVVIIDMTATTFCDGAGARAILRAYKRATDSGGELRLVVATAPVRRIFGLLGIDRVLDVYPSLKAARAVTRLAAAHERRQA